MNFTWNTPFKNWITFCEQENVCERALVWMRDLDEDGLTFGQAAEIYQSQPSKQSSQCWAAFVIAKYRKKLDAKLRLAFIKKITDPMIAFHIYCDYAPDITSEEELYLEGVFKNKLPNAEKQLLDGSVKRVEE